MLIWWMLSWGIYHQARLGLPASRGPSTFRVVRVCWCLSLPFSILFLFSLAFPLVITLELFTRLIHSSTVRHLSNAHWLDSRGTSGRNEGGGGGSGGGLNPPKCARKCANFRNLKANVQILDRKTPPPPKCFTLFRLLRGTHTICLNMAF